MSLVLFKMPSGFPEVVLFDDGNLIDIDYLDKVLNKLQFNRGETTYSSTKRIERYENNYVIIGSYGAVTVKIIAVMLGKYFNTIGVIPESRELNQLDLLILADRLPKRNASGEWHGGTTTDSIEIDDGIQPLVSTLNIFGVDTFSSCEGHGIRTPYVLFKSNFNTLETLGKAIHSAVSKLSEDDRVSMELRLLWNYGTWINSTGIYFELRFNRSCPTDVINRFNDNLKEQTKL